jgi:hypothetical protein
MSYEASPARCPSGRSLSRNAIVAQLARFGRAAPLSLGECTRLIDRRQRMLSALVASVRDRIRDAWL